MWAGKCPLEAEEDEPQCGPGCKAHWDLSPDGGKESASECAGDQDTGMALQGGRGSRINRSTHSVSRLVA